MIPLPDTSSNRIKLSRREYLIFGGAGFLFFFLIVLYVLEFPYFNRTFNIQTLVWISIAIGAVLGAFLAYRLRKYGKDLTDKIQIYVACILLCALFSPLLGSLSNRFLGFHPTTPQTFEFFKEEGYVSSRFGVLEGEDLELTGYYLFFFRGKELHRINTTLPLAEGIQPGDPITLPVRKGLWGFEWITK